MLIESLGSKVTVTPAEGDTSVTIADLARYIDFDPAEAVRLDTTLAIVAYNALDEYYGKFEKVSGECDYYDGVKMTFGDGSSISIRND